MFPFKTLVVTGLLAVSSLSAASFEFADLNHVLTFGQSNAQGYNQGQGAPITTTQPYFNVTFTPFTMRLHSQSGTQIADATSTTGMVLTDVSASGLRAPWENEYAASLIGGASTFWAPNGQRAEVWNYNDYVTKLATCDFRPLTEGYEPVENVEHSESIVSSLCNELTALTGKRYVGSCAGLGGANIGMLTVKPNQGAPDGYSYTNTVDLSVYDASLSGWYSSGAFASVLAQVRRAKELTEARGLTYKVAALCWIQGESDNGGEGYSAKLLLIVDSLNTCIKAITGQAEDVNVFTESLTYNDIEVGHWGVDDEIMTATAADSRLHLVMPRYQFNTDVHHSPAATVSRSHIYAEAIYKVLSGRTWAPLQPISHAIVGNDIYLNFAVVNPPLQFSMPESNSLTNPLSTIIANGGFSVLNSGSSEILTTVTIDGPITIKLACSESPVGGQINYGQTGDVGGVMGGGVGTRLRGSLCDSNLRPTLQRVGGTSYESRNYSVLFNYAL